MQVEQDLQQQEREFFSVGEACALINHSLKEIGSITIVGEVSEFRPPNRAGHVYATIKDEKTVLPLAIFNFVYKRVNLPLQVGDKIKVTGEFSYYEPSGRLSFKVTDYEFFGEGYLLKQIEALRKKLEAEGLFSPIYKHSVPVFAERVLAVTSPTGAVIDDVRQTLARRNPLVKLGYIGCSVQGKDAPQSIVEALKRADTAGADVVLLVRGGGSLEDLMAFNSEEVVRQIASMQTPVVTGVGHEPDTTLVDYAADLRASTPTAAAEAVAPTAQELSSQLVSLVSRMTYSERARIQREQEKVNVSLFSLFASEKTYLTTCAQKLAHLASSPALQAADSWVEQRKTTLLFTQDRLERACALVLEKARARLAQDQKALVALSPKRVLERGYALVTCKDAVLTSIASVQVGTQVAIELLDGTLGATVETITRKEQHE